MLQDPGIYVLETREPTHSTTHDTLLTNERKTIYNGTASMGTCNYLAPKCIGYTIDIICYKKGK